MLLPDYLFVYFLMAHNLPDNKYLCELVSSGTLSPLYFVPSAGMTPYSLINLARAVDPKAPIYSFNYGGTDNYSLPHNSYEEMAKDYVAEIRRLQPSGPYFIGGHCLGGLVALEIVTQLEVLYEKVALLILLDTPAPQVPVKTPEGATCNQATVDELSEHYTQAIQYLCEHSLQQFTHLPPSIAERLGDLLRIHIESAFEYRYSFIEANVALVRSNMNGDFVYHNWRTVCKGTFSEYGTPGDNFSMLQPPHVGPLGKQIGGLLRKW